MKIRKIFLYFIGISILFLNYFKANWFIEALYWISERPVPVDTWTNILQFTLAFLIIPIVFLIWLFFYFRKKVSKNKKNKK